MGDGRWAMGDGQPVKGTSNSAWYDAPLGESRL
jgi:hypothetical protein